MHVVQNCERSLCHPVLLREGGMKETYMDKETIFHKSEEELKGLSDASINCDKLTRSCHIL